MFCPSCGTQNAEGVRLCAQCGSLLQQKATEPMLSSLSCYEGVGVLGVLVILILLMSVDAWGQTAASPTRTQCKQWDDAYLVLFNYALWGTLAGTFILSLLAGALGSNSWLFTAPRLRIVIMTLLCIVVVTLGIALGPWTVGLGHWWFGGVDRRYYDCETVRFGAEGFFDGLVGSGVPVIAQWPIMILAFCCAGILGGVAAWLLSEIVGLRVFGVPARVKGGIE